MTEIEQTKTLPKTVELTDKSATGGIFTYYVRFVNMSGSEQEEAEEIGRKHGWLTSTFWTAPETGRDDTALSHAMRNASYVCIFK